MTCIEPRASHFTEQDEIKRWLGQHDLDASQIVEMRIEIGRDYNRGNVLGRLDVKFLLLNEEGRPYKSATAPGEPALGHATIPLRSWPRLTAIDG